MRCVPILPDMEAWPNKYVVVQFPEGDPKHDSRTLAKVRSMQAPEGAGPSAAPQHRGIQGSSGLDRT